MVHRASALTTELQRQDCDYSEKIKGYNPLSFHKQINCPLLKDVYLKDVYLASIFLFCFSLFVI